MKNALLAFSIVISFLTSYGQNVNKTMKRLPDTGETTSYTSTFGEDADYLINAPFFTNNGNGTVTDTVTGLMWQKTDGGEMTIENATIYCDTLTLAGYTDWRLPNAYESFSIMDHQRSNPAIDTAYFKKTDAEYWWTGIRLVNDSTKVWVTNWGGGIGAHPKSETVSAGGNKKIHVRAVREIDYPPVIPIQFTDNGNGTVTDNLTGLVWVKVVYADTITWEDALVYAESLSFAGQTDWRLPNIKELQSICQQTISNPTISNSFFSVGIKKIWSSTTLPNQTTKSWYIDSREGIATYDVKTNKHSVLCVRGNGSSPASVSKYETSAEVNIYPNPATDLITIFSLYPSVIEIVNIQGQVVKTVINETSKTVVDISTLPKGLYLIRSTSSDNISIKKFVKQ